MRRSKHKIQEEANKTRDLPYAHAMERILFANLLLFQFLFFVNLSALCLGSVLPETQVKALITGLGQWKPLNNDSFDGLHRFEETDYVFPVLDNLVFCRKNIETIHFDPNVDDWGPVIQAAFRRIFKLGGGTVRLSPGLFWQKTQFEIPSYCCLQGAGMYETILKTHVDAPHFPLAGQIRTAYTTRVSMFDFSQDGNRWKMKGNPQNRFGIYTDLANFVWMKNVRVVDNMWFGFDPHGANTAWSYNLIMEDCYASGNGKDGFTIDQYYYVSMLNSVAVDNDRHGINVVSGSRYVLVKGNRVRKNGYCSLIAQNNEFGTRSVLFMENVATDYRTAGLCLRGVMDVFAVRNQLYSTETVHASAFDLQNVWDIKLVATDWVQNGRKTNVRGDSRYTEYDTVVIPRTAEVVTTFNSFYDTIDHPPRELVDLMSTTYGTATVNNSVPLKLPKTENSLAPRLRTHNQFTDKKTNNAVDSDAKCSKGIVYGVACCPKKCGVCAETNCGNMGPECCPHSIRVDASSCDTFSPPCVLSRKYTTNGKIFGPPDPSCRYGRLNGKLCCQVSCKICGGKGCSDAGENEMCCQGKIEKLGRKCSEVAPPCIIAQ